MPDSDSGSLLTTLSSGGTTLVAIVGGLLVSSYVTLDSERRTAERRVSGLRERERPARDAAAEATRAWDQFHLDDALNNPHVHDLFVTFNETTRRAEHRPTPRPDQVAAAADASDLNPTLLHHRVELWADATAEVLQ